MIEAQATVTVAGTEAVAETLMTIFSSACVAFATEAEEQDRVTSALVVPTSGVRILLAKSTSSSRKLEAYATQRVHSIAAHNETFE